MDRAIVLLVVSMSLGGVVGCGAGSRSHTLRPTGTLPARTADGLVSIPWTFAGADGTTVTLRYDDSGCGYTFAHTATLETSRTVTIAVYDDQQLGENVACPADLVIASTAVQLRAALDGRTLRHAPVWRPSSP